MASNRPMGSAARGAGVRAAFAWISASPSRTRKQHNGLPWPVLFCRLAVSAAMNP